MDGENTQHNEVLNKLRQSLETAIELYSEIDGSSTDHFSFEVANTKVVRIKELVTDDNVTWDNLFFEELNVGLQAAKSLDLFNYQGAQKKYIRLLHRISYLVLKLYYMLPKMQGSLLVAYQFYLNHGYDKYKIHSHINGIDFSKPIKIIPLTFDQDIYQYQTYCSKKNYNTPQQMKKIYQGDYYSPLPKINPSSLGINYYFSCKRCYKTHNRLECDFKVKGTNIYVLESVAASIWDDWSIPNHRIRTMGGATQYFNHNDHNKIK